jgi:hypothetical protein
VNGGDKLAAGLVKVRKHLRDTGKIDDTQLGVLTKFQHSDQLVSVDTLNRYVHSPSIAPQCGSAWRTSSVFAFGHKVSQGLGLSH